MKQLRYDYTQAVTEFLPVSLYRIVKTFVNMLTITIAVFIYVYEVVLTESCF